MIMVCVDDYSRWATCEFYSSRKKAPFQAMLARLEGRVHAHSRQCYEARNTPGTHNGRPALCMRTDGEGTAEMHVDDLDIGITEQQAAALMRSSASLSAAENN